MSQVIASITPSELSFAERVSSGQQISAQAEYALRRSPYRSLRQLSCQCTDNVLKIFGWVPTYHLKQVAQTLVARQLTDAVRIDNRVEVRLRR